MCRMPETAWLRVERTGVEPVTSRLQKGGEIRLSASRDATRPHECSVRSRRTLHKTRSVEQRVDQFVARADYALLREQSPRLDRASRGGTTYVTTVRSRVTSAALDGFASSCIETILSSLSSRPAPSHGACCCDPTTRMRRLCGCRVALLSQLGRRDLRPSYASPLLTREPTGFVRPVSGRWAFPKPRQPAPSAPLHVGMDQQDERLDVAVHQRFVSRADGISGHAEDGSEISRPPPTLTAAQVRLGIGLALSVDRLTCDRVAHSAGEPLPRGLLCHAERFTDLSPTPTRLSGLADCLTHSLLQRRRCPAALAQSLDRMCLPVSERPQPEVATASDDAHAWRSKCHRGLFRVRCS
jgi:hypothetical protein